MTVDTPTGRKALHLYHGDSESWVARASEKRAECFEAIPKDWVLTPGIIESLEMPLEEHKNEIMALDIPRRSGILTERELQITEDYDVSALLQKLATGAFTAAEVTLAFSKRAAIAQQLTNCLTETFFDQAMARAQELDSLMESGKLAGPLHGLPISLKDCFHVTGTQATLGLIAYLDKYSDTNACLVDMLLSLGAVIYVKTNIPQTMMTADSDNNVFGRVLNPWNTMLGAGGSSGGEGALVAFRGSPLGVGTDIAGSIRIPALCCGTYGFKPTASRVPYGGQQSCSNRGLKFINACAGPLANDINALEIFVKAVIDARPSKYDSTVIDVPWRALSSDPNRKLRLGVLAEDPKFPLHPSIKKAIKEATERLEADGHHLIRLNAEDCQISSTTKIAWDLFGFDKTASLLLSSAGEKPIRSQVQIAAQIQEVYSMGAQATASTETEMDRLAAANIKRSAAIENWRKIWNLYELDAVVGPAAQNTAVEHDMYGLPPYTVFLNVLDYPACVIPFGRADGSTEPQFDLQPGQGGAPYNPTLMQGAPLSIQVFTSGMRDEECLDISKVVDKSLNGTSRGMDY
ncbi:amidase signature domain-containing protein [Ilyonectria robusta]|uniref:amidase signature domain-containing protein n=1 Tax=Ilyonectria robusta TaxID=1079257 RepID=UPI001E8DD403|nr:amidase signature domain-containing protein [Ilyonectria robusta]KAH8738373.1 amidase signature domain-containing protein [Ilyonectria robusta]